MKAPRAIGYSGPGTHVVQLGPPGPLTFLALGQPRRNAERDDLIFYEAADLELFTAWTQAGIASWPLLRMDRSGIVFTLTVPQASVAARLIARLPSVSADLVTFTLLPFAPFRTWRQI